MSLNAELHKRIRTGKRALFNEKSTYQITRRRNWSPLPQETKSQNECLVLDPLGTSRRQPPRKGSRSPPQLETGQGRQKCHTIFPTTLASWLAWEIPMPREATKQRDSLSNSRECLSTAVRVGGGTATSTSVQNKFARTLTCTRIREHKAITKFC